MGVDQPGEEGGAVTVTRTGPTPEQVLAIAQDNVGPLLLERARQAMDRFGGGAFQKTGHLKRGLTVVRTANGHELHCPPDRLQTTETRQKFLDLLRVWMGAAR